MCSLRTEKQSPLKWLSHHEVDKRAAFWFFMRRHEKWVVFGSRYAYKLKSVERSLLFLWGTHYIILLGLSSDRTIGWSSDLCSCLVSQLENRHTLHLCQIIKHLSWFCLLTWIIPTDAELWNMFGRQHSTGWAVNACWFTGLKLKSMWWGSDLHVWVWS